MMSRKHYEGIANALREVMEVSDHELEEETVRWVALRLSAFLAEDNPRFDREKFLKACVGK